MSVARSHESDALRAIALVLLPYVRELLAPQSLEYTSVHLPDDVRTRDTFARICAAIARAGGAAERRGRIWVCSRDAWVAYRRAPASRKRAAVPVAPVSVERVIDPDDAVLAELGARRVEKGKK